MKILNKLIIYCIKILWLIQNVKTFLYNCNSYKSNKKLTNEKFEIQVKNIKKPFSNFTIDNLIKIMKNQHNC